MIPTLFLKQNKKKLKISLKSTKNVFGKNSLKHNNLFLHKQQTCVENVTY